MWVGFSLQRENTWPRPALKMSEKAENHMVITCVLWLVIKALKFSRFWNIPLWHVVTSSRTWSGFQHSFIDSGFFHNWDLQQTQFKKELNPFFRSAVREKTIGCFVETIGCFSAAVKQILNYSEWADKIQCRYNWTFYKRYLNMTLNLKKK